MPVRSNDLGATAIAAADATCERAKRCRHRTSSGIASIRSEALGWGDEVIGIPALGLCRRLKLLQTQFDPPELFAHLGSESEVRSRGATVLRLPKGNQGAEA